MTGPERAPTSTGFRQQAPASVWQREPPPYDPVARDHLWVAVLAFQVQPELWADASHTPTMDLENLVQATSPGCYYCEQLYTPRLAKRRCSGDPPR
jgi:hypothetical protein